MKIEKSTPKFVPAFEGQPQTGNSQRPTTPVSPSVIERRGIPDVGNSQRPVTQPPTPKKNKD